MNTPFIVFGSPDIADDEIEEVVATLRSGWLGSGPRVAAFEAQFAAFKGVAKDQVAAVNSCTAALHLSLLAAGVGPGDEVITPALTFCAAPNAILLIGATPVLADIDSETMNVDPAQIESRITARTKALLPVHFAGRPCDMDAIAALAARHRLVVVEDCAHAVEALHHGRSVGTLGDFGCFSFYATKNVTTGEGGMVLSRNRDSIARIKRMALHGLSADAWRRFSDQGYTHHQVVDRGFKYNMMDLQAAIGLHQLRRVESAWLRRRAIWERYQSAFAALPVGRPTEPSPEVRHAHHLYTLLIDEEHCGIARDAFMVAMTERGIGVGVHYTALPEHRYYQDLLHWRPEDTPRATKIGRQTVSLPLSPKLTDAQIDQVVAAVVQTLSGRGRR